MQEEITQLSETHLDAAINLIVEVRRQELPLLDDSIDEHLPPDIEEPYRTGSGKFWIALVDDNVIGTVGLVDLDSGQGCLQKMYVHPNFRGTGAALRLLNTLIDWADSRQIRDIYLGTFSKNRAARRFYEKHGFGEISNVIVPVNCPRSDLEDCFYHRSLRTVPTN